MTPSPRSRPRRWSSSTGRWPSAGPSARRPGWTWSTGWPTSRRSAPTRTCRRRAPTSWPSSADGRRRSPSSSGRPGSARTGASGRCSKSGRRRSRTEDRVHVARPAAGDGAVLDVVTFQVRERIVVRSLWKLSCFPATSPWLEQAREVGALAELGNLQLEGADTGVPLPLSIAVAVGGASRRALVGFGADEVGHLGVHQLLRQQPYAVAQEVR